MCEIFQIAKFISEDQNFSGLAEEEFFSFSIAKFSRKNIG
jgi:hypothetical protein